MTRPFFQHPFLQEKMAAWGFPESFHPSQRKQQFENNEKQTFTSEILNVLKSN